jgi:hypothetical protein
MWLLRSQEEEKRKSPVEANKKGEQVQTKLPYARKPR